jgi:hypothetical protein
MMESSELPTYEEATDIHKQTGPPNGIGGQINACSQCGASVLGPNFCAYCGHPLVQTTQPTSSALPIPANRLPPASIFTVSFPERDDIEHKHDMACKHGNRLIYDFEKVACCPFQVVGLDPKVADKLPWELEQKGITKEKWREWMLQLMENQKRAPSITGCLCMFCFPGGLAQSILCALFCPISMDHCFKWLPCCYGDWYAVMRAWQDEVNTVLNQHDMHIKLMTYKPWQKAPQSKLHGTRIAGKDHNYEMSMMVISLTSDETQKLKIESWDHGVNDGCTSGIGRLL